MQNEVGASERVIELSLQGRRAARPPSAGAVLLSSQEKGTGHTVPRVSIKLG